MPLRTPAKKQETIREMMGAIRGTNAVWLAV
jgi:hypothetical protein